MSLAAWNMCFLLESSLCFSLTILFSRLLLRAFSLYSSLFGAGSLNISPWIWTWSRSSAYPVNDFLQSLHSFETPYPVNLSIWAFVTWACKSMKRWGWWVSLQYGQISPLYTQWHFSKCLIKACWLKNVSGQKLHSAMPWWISSPKKDASVSLMSSILSQLCFPAVLSFLSAN